MGHRQAVRWAILVAGLTSVMMGGWAPAAWGQVSFRLIPSAALTVEYDDNIFFTVRQREEEVVTRVRASLAGDLETPRSVLTGSVVATHELFLRATREASPSLALGPLTFLYRATPRLTLTVSESFLITRQASTVSSADATAVNLGRVDSQRQSAAFTARYRVSPLSDLTSTLTHTLTTFPNVENRDSQNVTASVSLTRTLTPRVVLVGNLRYSLLDLEQRADSNTVSPSVGVTYLVSPRLIVTATVGPNFIHINGGTSRTGLGASASAAYTFPRATLVGSFTQDSSSGAATTANVDVRRLTVRYTRTHTPRLNSFAGLGATQNDTRDGQRVVLSTISADAGVVYRLTRLLSLSGRYLFQLSTSDVSGPSTTRRSNVVSVTLTGTWE